MEWWIWFACWIIFYFRHAKDYFESVVKKHETIADNSPVQIYINKIKNRIASKIKTAYKLEELLSSTTMKLLGSTKNDVD